MALRRIVLLSVSFQLQTGVPAGGKTLCLGPNEIDEFIGTVDCGFTNAYPTYWLGFSEERSELCTNCGCQDPEFCSCCPYDDAGQICGQSIEFAWSISASSADPLQIFGAIPADRWLYLWLVVSRVVPFAAAECRITGSLTPVAFEPMNGVELLPFGAFPDLVFTVPECQDAPFLAGRILVEDPSPVEAMSWGRTKSLYRK
jgi:hypothetical protein